MVAELRGGGSILHWLEARLARTHYRVLHCEIITNSLVSLVLCALQLEAVAANEHVNMLQGISYLWKTLKNFENWSFWRLLLHILFFILLYFIYIVLDK